jgi:peptidoglycan/LPS O-acetylase OafA/YrhL
MGLVRLLLALAVVAAHAGPAFGSEALRLTGGPPSVQVFYVVSGFYMALVLNTKYVGRSAYTTFAKSRLLRLVPMFVAVLLLTIGTALVLEATAGARIEPLERWRTHGAALPWPDWLTLAATNALLVGQDAVCFFAVDAQRGLYFTTDFHAEPLPAWQFQWVPQAWTVALELMFYAVAPFLVRRRWWILAAVAAASVALRVGLMAGLDLRNDPWTYRFFPTELALFLAGSLAFHAYRAAGRRGLLRPALCHAATVLLLGLVVAFPWLPDLLRLGHFGVPGLVPVAAALLPFVFHATRKNTFYRALGELSYPVYLVHYLLVFVVGALALPWSTAASGTVVAAGTLALAWALWRGVGLPIEARRQGLARGLMH